MSNGSKSGGLAAELLPFAQAQLGTLCQAEDVSWDHGESEVWLVTGIRGQAVLKRHRQRRKFEQERRAYSDWLPSLGFDSRSSPAWRTPCILAAIEQPRALLLTRERGLPLEGMRLPPDLERPLHLAAGRFLSALHRLPRTDTDPLPLAEALLTRAKAWILRAQPLLERSVGDAVWELSREAAAALGDRTRVPCHRDFTPRNWLADRAAPDRLTLIDFEHSRSDLGLMDLERLWSGTWPDRPDLREAFLEGYGGQLSDEEEQLLERLSALAGLGTVVWAHEHGDREFEERGRAQLRRLGLRV